MITSILINALGQALFESCGQALIIYIVLQLLMHLFPGINSKYRYNINYLALTVICGWFFVNLVKIYTNAIAVPDYKLFIYGNVVSGNVHLPTLLQQAEAYIAKYSEYIAGLYFIGLMLHAFRLAGGLVHINYIRKPENLSKDCLLSQKTRLLGKALKISKTVSLYFSEHVQIPLTIGHLKPIIIFPLGLINNLDNDQVEAILLHELAHIKRNDYLLNLLQCVMETILCFNPFAWLISKTIREEREYCCDDMVVDAGFNNYSYSKALFIIAQQNNQRYTLAMASTDSRKYPLLNRIKRLNTMKTNDSLPKFHLLIIFAIVSIGILLAWGIPQYSMAKTAAHKTIKAITHPINTIHGLTAPAISNGSDVVVAPVVHKHRSITYVMDTASNKNLNDTTVSGAKSKFKIVVEDDKGNKKEYNSLDELPVQDKKEFFEENHTLGDRDSIKFAADKYFKSPEWRAQMLAMKIQGEDMRKKFDNPEFRKQMDEVGIKMRKQFNSPEWKKQMQDMKVQGEKMAEEFRNNPEWKKQMEDMQMQGKKMGEQMRAQFDSPEWKKQMEDMKMQSEKMGEQMREKFNSPEWRKQMENMKVRAEVMSKEMNNPKWKREMERVNKESEKIQKQVEKEVQDKYNSPEWRKQQEDLQRKIEDIQKKVNDEVNKDIDKARQDTTKN